MVRLRKKRNKLKILSLFLLLVFLLALVGVIFKIWRSISRSLWDGKNQLNLAISSQSVLIASFNPQEKSLNMMLIPQGTFIETIHGYGPCRVESIYRLGELNNRGGEILKGSLQEYLDIPIDGYASISNFQLPIANLGTNKSFISLITAFLRGEGETNLTRWDLIRFFWFLRNLRENKINLIDLSKTNVIEEFDLPDGSKANKINKEHLELVINQFFIDKRIKEEDLTLVVLNATEHTGLANKMSLLIKNIGGNLVGIGETEKSKLKIQNSKCEIRSQKKDKNTYTVQKLMKIFGCQWGGEDLENQRSDVVLIIGEGYWERLNLP